MKKSEWIAEYNNCIDNQDNENAEAIKNVIMTLNPTTKQIKALAELKTI